MKFKSCACLFCILGILEDATATYWCRIGVITIAFTKIPNPFSVTKSRLWGKSLWTKCKERRLREWRVKREGTERWVSFLQTTWEKKTRPSSVWWSDSWGMFGCYSNTLSAVAKIEQPEEKKCSLPLKEDQELLWMERQEILVYYHTTPCCFTWQPFVQPWQRHKSFCSGL